MCNGDLDELLRCCGKLSQWIRRAVRGTLPEHSIKEEEINERGKKEKRHEGSSIHVIWNPEHESRVENMRQSKIINWIFIQQLFMLIIKLKKFNFNAESE